MWIVFIFCRLFSPANLFLLSWNSEVAISCSDAGTSDRLISAEFPGSERR